jgi:hypothetical protein
VSSKRTRRSPSITFDRTRTSAESSPAVT